MRAPESNVHNLLIGAADRFHINSAYDTLFGLMDSCNEVSSNDNHSTGDNLLENIDSESLNTDDFSSSTSTDLKTSSTSPSDELKTSSSSNTENGTPNKKDESETASDDHKPSSSDEPNLTLGTATETDSINFHDESEPSSDDRKPSSRHDSQEGKGDSRPSIPSDQHAIQASLKQANQNHESFPCTLRRILNVETQAGHRSIQWLSDGDGFEVIDQNTLEKEVLPNYFPSSSLFQSFVRKLYRWGFLQVGGKKKSGHYVFSNESFHRDNDSYKNLKAIPRPRRNKKQAGIKHRQNPLNHPVDQAETPTATPVDPNHLTNVQNDVTSQLNSIITSYSNNPDALSSLQGTISNILSNQITYSSPQNQPTPGAGTFQPPHDQNIPPRRGNSEGQASVRNALIENVVRFLAQGQQGSVPPQAASLEPITHGSTQGQQGDVQYAQGNLQPMLHHRARNGSNNRFNQSQEVTDTAGTTTGTTTDTSATSQGQSDFAQQIGTEPKSAPRKRQRSSSPP